MQYQYINKILKYASTVTMMLALLWLTISAPFLLASQQEFASHQLYNMDENGSSVPGADDECTNPFGNNTEEKAPSGSSFSEEWLHDNHKPGNLLAIASQYHKGEDDGTYIAFHGELLVPPPNFS